MTAATQPEKLIYWEVVAATGTTPTYGDAPLPVPTFDDLWQRYPLTSYDERDMIVHHEPASKVDTTFMDRVARPAGIFNQAPTTHSPTGPELAKCVCGETWPCTKAGESLSREIVPLRAVEPEWPTFIADASEHQG